MTEAHATADDLGDLFIAVTGGATVTQSQTEQTPDRELRSDPEVDEAIDDGLGEAIAGAQPDPGDPGEVGTAESD